MLTKIVLVIVGILLLTLFLFLVRRTLGFVFGASLLLAGSAGAIFGLILLFAESSYLWGGGLLFFSIFLGYFGWELFVWSNKIKVPKYASEAGSSYDPVHGAQPAGRNLYDRHSGTHFGSGF